MLLKAAALEGIVEGRISYAFRWWRRPGVRAGTVLRTPRGLVRIEAIEEITPGEVTDADARDAGLASAADVLVPPPRHQDARLYRIRLSYAGTDPRVALRQQADLTAHDVADLRDRLARFDRASTRGPWTAATLELIGQHPHTLAADLARTLDVDKMWFKRNVRKLKELGLTESLERGYRLSPRGRAYLARTAARGQDPAATRQDAADFAGVRAYCLSMPGAVEGHPFGPGALVVKVAGRIFAIIGEDSDPASISLKCEPEEAAALRHEHAAVQPGYHLDKRHWNTVTLDGTIPAGTVHGWIEDSYDLVVEKLPRRAREELAAAR